MDPVIDLANGILIVDKPQDWTSHDVCAFIRKKFKIKKVGHAGTLDPMATGVLVVLLGKATKLSMKLTANDKEYSGVMRLGVQTDSHDRTGKVIAQKNADFISLENVKQVSRQFIGSIKQLPPMVSALKHKGVRFYELARRGLEVPREERSVTVHEFEIKDKQNDLVYFSCYVSKGTYLRTLVHDLGIALESFATLEELKRVRSGQYEISQSVTIDAIRKWTMADLMKHMLPLTQPQVS